MSRLKELRKRSGKTQAQVARELGMDLTNYNRLENGRTQLTVDRLQELATLLNASPAEFVGPATMARIVRVIGHVQAGHWAESNHWEEDDQYDVAVPQDPKFAGIALFGLELRGVSMNKVYADRTVVVCTNFVETGGRLEPGKRYVVERERADGLRETTIKKLVLDSAKKPWLMPESDDPHHQQPISLEGEEDETIRIVGRVSYSVMRED